MEREITQQSIGIDAIFQYASSGVQLISGMLFYIVISHLFYTNAVGAVAIFLAIIGLFNTLFSFGLGNAAQHFTSYGLGNGDLSAVRKTVYKFIMFGISFSSLGFLVLISMSSEISLIFLHSESYVGLIRLLSLVLLGNTLLGILNGILLGIQNFKFSAILNIVVWVTYYFGSLLFAFFIRSLHTIIIGWIIGVFLGVIIELIFILYSIKSYNGVGKSPHIQN